MTTRSTVHDTFVIDRHYDAAPPRIYRAFADPETKAVWFGGPDEKRSLDFREGGRETLFSTLPDGREMAFYATYTDIVPDERIVYTYEMTMGGERISVSVVTIEVVAVASGGADLRITEQGVYLDGLDQPAMRRDGTEQLLDLLAETLVD
jgi:uncharacterized protein YndB with AHSA1/START domain